MKLFTSLASFVAVAAILFPLYNDDTAIFISLGGGLLVAIFVYVAFNLQKQEQEKQMKKLEEVLTLSSTNMMNGFRDYQQQLTGHVGEVAKATNDTLLDTWKDTQAVITKDTQVMYDQSSTILQQLAELQKQQDTLSKEMSTFFQKEVQQVKDGLQTWLAEQQQAAINTFNEVKNAHASLLTRTNEAHTTLETMWKDHQQEQITIRKQEQARLQEMLQAVEAKEAAYSQHLQDQRAIFEQAQQQLKDILSEQAQLSHKALLDAWKQVEQEQLTLRKEERDHVLQTQDTVVQLLEEKATALNTEIVTAWETTRTSLTELRKKEQQHTVQLLQTVEQANTRMVDTLTQQGQAFETAQRFYEDTYKQIETYTTQLQDQQTQLANHHQQLIDTQAIIKDSIEQTLQTTMAKHTSVLTEAQQALTSGLEELRDQRATSNETFEEFIEEFLNTLEEQEKQSAQLLGTLNKTVTEMTGELKDSVEDSMKDQKRAAEIFQSSMNKVAGDMTEVMEGNQHLFKSLNEQAKATQATAKTLQGAFKEISTLNQKDMDLLERLMR